MRANYCISSGKRDLFSDFLNQIFLIDREISLPHLAHEAGLELCKQTSNDCLRCWDFMLTHCSVKNYFRRLKTPAARKEVAGTVVTVTSGVLSGENFLSLRATTRERIPLKAWSLWGLDHSPAARLIPH